MRKAPTKSMENAIGLIEQAESNELCEMIDKLIEKNTVVAGSKPRPCKDALNGMINNGLQITYSYIIAEFFKFRIRFASTPKDADTLLKHIKDE